MNYQGSFLFDSSTVPHDISSAYEHILNFDIGHLDQIESSLILCFCHVSFSSTRPFQARVRLSRPFPPHTIRLPLYENQSREQFDFVQTERKQRTKYRRSNVSQSLKPESKFFYSMDVDKYFVYKVERPKGKYTIPVILCVKNDVRRMFQYKYVIEGISLACNSLLKNFKSLINYYAESKANTLESIRNELTVLQQELSGTMNAEMKLNLYNRISALKNNQLTFESIEETLRRLKLSLVSLDEGYDIEIIKTIFSQVFVRDNHFYLIYNPTNSPINLSNNLNIFLSVKVSSITNYKMTELDFSIVLV